MTISTSGSRGSNANELAHVPARRQPFAEPGSAGRERRAARDVRIAVCRPQVPFVRGGAELVADDLVDELRARGHEAEIVAIPFKWYPGTRVLDQAFLWRLLDLTEADGREIELVIATKFPAYCVRHPNKVAWVLHQFRQAYDYDRTELAQFSGSPEDRATVAAIK